MNRTALILASCMIVSCTNYDINQSEERDQKVNYKSWVLSRCLSYIISDVDLKQDVLNTSSAYLEVSSLPLESFLESEPLIRKFISLDYGGSIPDSFNTKKCIDLFSSDELDSLYYRQLK